MEGLRGSGFASALTIMNCVPNSPINRYVEVDNAVVENNTVVDSRRVTLGAGADEERSAPPINSVFANNLLGGLEDGTFVEVDADISGIAFANNRLVSGRVHSAFADAAEQAPAVLERAANGLLYPVGDDLDNVGASRDLKVVTLDDVGVSWYAKPGPDEGFGGSGTVTDVAPGEDTLVQAVLRASEGDVITLEAGGVYIVNRALPIEKTLTFRGGFAEEAAPPVIYFTRPTLMELREGGNLQLTNLVIDGELAPDSVGNSMIRTTSFPIQSNLRIELDSVTVKSLVVNKSFNVITLGKNSLADRVSIQNSNFADITGSVVSAAAETEDYGQYNVEYLDIVNSNFFNVGGPIADVYRGGRDESTFGPFVTITDNNMLNVGLAPTNGSGASVHFHGVQIADLSRNNAASSAPFRVVHTVGTPRSQIIDNNFADVPEIVLEELNYEGEHRAVVRGNEFAEENAE